MPQERQNSFAMRGLYIPHYNESHSKPVPSFRNNDDHKMAFHTWHTQSAVKNN